MKPNYDENVLEQEIYCLKEKNKFLKRIIIFLIFCVCILYIEVWQMEFEKSQDYTCQVLTNVDEINEIMSFKFIKVRKE